ncbi:D-aminoacylase [Flavobacteriaceae bacterium]|jgi:N-acyl-D-amino-acid deacylase|nr:D-aminoacylase [Flavobacteriaceae bacterium]MDA9037947.1 D-aminoacylase [Flavobacteriaceae bacterium]MDC0872026.1 D-aminoacylase [Flavobacteriaceae bacterium]
MKKSSLLLYASIALFFSCSQGPKVDVVIQNGTLYDGTGSPPFIGTVAIKGDKIVYVGPPKFFRADQNINATDKAVSPGFINMLSWGVDSLIEDGKSQSDIFQGVTLEVFGEGMSWGPLNDPLKASMKKKQGDIQYEITWTTLGEYLQFLEDKGVSTNVASFLGATTLRINAVGYEDRAPNVEELELMKDLVHQGMKEGAMGIGSSLIYAPAFYSSTEELIEICKVAADYGGMYISHMRSEGNKLLESVDELLTIANEAGIPAEIYHLKQSGKKNWGKLDRVIQKIDSARAKGLKITTDMYTYTAGATGLDASMPPWVQEGGLEQWIERLKDPQIRKRVIKEMKTDTDEWENLMRAAESPDKLILVGFKNDSLKYLTGKTLTEVAKIKGKSPEETAIDLVIQDGSRVGTVYFLMDEENIKRQIQLPYMSFGSDAGSLATEGVFLKNSTHPRAFGNFARLLGKYVRDEQIIPMEEAIYKLSGLPATNLKIKERGFLKENYFADVVVFDPKSIRDFATFENPMQYATGIEQVWVNGTHVLENGTHTGAFGGRFVKGPGYQKQ